MRWLSKSNRRAFFTDLFNHKIQAATMQADKKVYSPLMRKHAATVSNLHYPTVDVASNGDVRVTIEPSPAPPAPPETETETDKTDCSSSDEE